MKKIILVRHGESTLNVTKVFYGRLDPDLTAKGREQAESARKVLEKFHYDKIYSSDLKRAHNTAKIVNYKDLDIEISTKIRELDFGIFEGLAYEEIKEKYPKELETSSKEWRNYSYETGESLFDVQKRVVEFIDSLEDDKTHLLVVHWGVICTALSYYLSNELDGYWKYEISNGSLSILEFRNEKHPVLSALNLKGE